MSPRPPLPGGPYLVVGLARSGLAALQVLRARGERAEGADRKLGTDGVAELEHARAVVKSPGVPAEAPVIAQARERGIPVLGEVELAWRLIPNEFVAVTGTNGKTTTVELVGHIHREAALPVAVAGNVGTALSTLVDTLAPETVVVCEVSSFQLEDTLAFAPEGAVLLNLAPDHLDRHGTFEAYRDAKLRVFANQGNDDVAVAPAGLGVEDLGGCARRVCFGSGPDAEVAERAGQLWWGDEPLLGVDEIRLRGAHNRANAMAAAAVCLARGIDPEAVRDGLRTFAGVEHRLEEVATVDGVLYVNDSKATNVDSTLVALASFDRPVHLVLGGRGKGQDFAPLRAPLAERAAGVYLIGEAAPALRDVLGRAARDCGDLERAVAAARAAAAPGEVVLLSPACASFDQYEDFEARGRHFKELVGRVAAARR
ncbi:MAG TPA: UDP-N-acetylmuramoyl-L-alanine--D-glutamate ligase [Solirubrobacteraceae bacterium]|nr:UDP-N-acetylmuramoyl-L-alanine--D-glutamate ligase [Solirubrobacteraceae bacterium]